MQACNHTLPAGHNARHIIGGGLNMLRPCTCALQPRLMGFAGFAAGLYSHVAAQGVGRTLPTCFWHLIAEAQGTPSTKPPIQAVHTKPVKELPGVGNQSGLNAAQTLCKLAAATIHPVR